MDKSPDAFRTITEVAEWLDTPAHVLRFWESRFSQIKPVKRAGGRRYYRPIDMLLLGGIKKMLHDDGTTIKAVQNILREQGIKHVQSLSQPVSVKVSVKKKEPTAAKATALVNETTPAPKPIAAAAITPPPRPPAAAKAAETAPPPLQEPPSDPIIDPMAERAAMPAGPVSAPAPIPAEIKPPEPQAQEPMDLIDDSEQTDDEDLDLPQSASLGEPDITVVKFPETLKSASEVPYKDMQEIEALYYSLKMVRNNMKRTGAGR